MGFYSRVADSPRDDLMAGYLAFLLKRNGTTDPLKAYPLREAWLEKDAGVRWDGIKQAQFEHNYARFDPSTTPSQQEIALLAFVKANAGEAYGVDVISKRRHGHPAINNFDKLERVLGKEETYHTRILLGATKHFGIAAPNATWRPPFSQRLLIATLAYAPKLVFHPILLAAEIAGVFTFTWMFERVGQVFKDSPALRDAMQERMSEVLIDEVGHIAFNRMAVGPAGLSIARKLAPLVAHQTSGLTAEFAALGWSNSTLDRFDSFDLASLPAHVREHAFFV